MEVLRPPPGHRDDEAPSPPRNRFSRFVFALLFLVIGMVVFFIGGIVVRNPELPNYLLDRFVRGFRDAATRSTTTRNYEVDQLLGRQILPGFPKIQPGSDVSEIRGALEKCNERAQGVIEFYQNLAEQIAGKLISAGVPSSLAHQTGEFFAARAQSQKNVSTASELKLACKSMTTMVDLLVKPPVNWKRDSAGRVVFTTQAMADQYNAASQEFASHIDALNAAFKPFIGG